MAEIEVRLLLTNSSDRFLSFVLEPWGEVYAFEPEAQISLVLCGPEGGHPEVDYGSEAVTVWSWSGSTARVFKNDIELGVGEFERTPVPDMSGLNIAEPRWK
jgi:hypothetical protein